MIDIRAGGATDVGQVRAKNQDALLVVDRLFAVADGMGGHQGGEVASRIAVDVLGVAIDDPSADSLMTAAQRANDAIFERAEAHADLHGMGTTLCAMALVDDADGEAELAVINVGDSRLYLLRDGELVQVTRDHSLVEDMRAAGQISEAEAKVHPHRNIVTRALGIAARVDIDEFTIIPRSDDRYILCSDGLFNEVSAERITATLRRLADPKDAASELVRLANEGGGRDNITCVVVDVVDDDGRAARAAAAGVASIRSRPGRPDVAGITTAEVDPDAHAAPVTKPAPPPAPEPEGPKLRRATWRTAAFVVLFVAILVAAAGAVGWYSRGSYYVGYDAEGQVTVFKGRPDPVLWFHPTVEQRTGIAKAQVPGTEVDAIASGKQVSSLAAADDYLANMRSLICSSLRNGAKPDASETGGPTTTIPEQCADALAPSSSSTTAAPTTVARSATTAPRTTR